MSKSEQTEYGLLYYDIFRESYVIVVDEWEIVLECKVVALHDLRFRFDVFLYRYKDLDTPNNQFSFYKAHLRGEEIENALGRVMMIDIVEEYVTEIIKQYINKRDGIECD